MSQQPRTRFVAEALEDLTLEDGTHVKKGTVMEVHGLRVRVLDSGHGHRVKDGGGIDAPALNKVRITTKGTP